VQAGERYYEWGAREGESFRVRDMGVARAAKQAVVASFGDRSRGLAAGQCRHGGDLAGVRRGHGDARIWAAAAAPSDVAVVGCSGWCCSALARGGTRISEAAAAAGLVHLPQLRQRRARISEAAVAASKQGRAASLRMQTSKQGSRCCSGQRHHASGSKKNGNTNRQGIGSEGAILDIFFWSGRISGLTNG
jgi:hypothetical protein